MDCRQNFVFTVLFVSLHVGTYTPVRGCSGKRYMTTLKKMCSTCVCLYSHLKTWSTHLTDEVYPSDSLNVSTCDTQKLVLGWNINQKIFDINLQYLCVNPSGVSVFARNKHGVHAQHTTQWGGRQFDSSAVDQSKI